MQNGSNTSSYDAFINNINNELTFIYLIVYTAIGIPGNLLSMVIFVRLAIRNPKINMGLLYTCQTIIDLITVVFTLLVTRGSVYIFGINLLTLSDSYCRMTMYFRRYLIHLSSWMLVLISFDRFVFVLYGQRFKFMKNKLILSAIILAMFILIAVLDMPNLFYYIAKTPMRTCIASYAVIISSDILAVCLRLYIPVLLIAIFNGLVTHRLVKKSRSLNANGKSSSSLRIRKRENYFTIAVMSGNCVFFLLNLPIAVFYILYDVHLYSGAFINDSTFLALYSLYFNVFLSLSSLFAAFSIFFYLGFNKLFRKEFYNLFLSSCFSCRLFANLRAESSVSLTNMKRNEQASL